MPLWILLPDYSKLNATPYFLPVVVCQPANDPHIALKQCDQVQPKTGRCVQPRRFPFTDITIGWAKGIGWLCCNQPEDDTSGR
jgi:hypothetical protein